ncbi:DNA topoisomerase I [Boudabousia tangfeifanii]|uniref:DNA topoisomerase 1 n=1 Tax=Boudabousia tangfeifanii TaxID=1912795 RepID=A0A1D9MM48_9ACTO|nr:type I DNA topoisomerase [Boudabousia tangfeifanii]AOZ73269.1 DNA topoisomerase I [Boudabousia tangfeifanii]
MANKLVIVESPAKARTIGTFLGKDFTVEASIGHIRDLPQPSELPATMKKGPYGKFAVDVNDGFKPYYVVDPDKKKLVTALKKALKEADELYLATDEDREGEAIAWHLLEVLKPKVPVKRMVFHEITKEAIGRALDNPRDLDTNLVDAQETRRILDRLVGYEVSPLLWRKVGAGLSAGRVQSVATRLVVDRERERMAFKSANYWDVSADLLPQSGPDAGSLFTARLTALGDHRVATSRDFNDAGELRPASQKQSVVHLGEAAAKAIADALAGAPAKVSGLETKESQRRPLPPFTTSTLQQEASRKLRMSARDTMRTAQTLYENGFITYMRTDSTDLSTQAISAARSQAAELYGADHVPANPNHYGKKAKGAQEAHEAIRPAGDNFRRPTEVKGQLTGAQFALYDLIWKRTVASQMKPATVQTATLSVQAPLGDLSAVLGAEDALGVQAQDVQATLSASGTIVTFKGFLAAYEEGRDEEERPKANGDTRLPQVSAGDALETDSAQANGHDTNPPARYTEASLVKKLEELGIGRPSTYAATISVIMDRGYVERRGQALIPSWLAFSVTRLLEDNLGGLVDYDFTASMERDLDLIASGELNGPDWLGAFYLGEGDLPVTKALPGGLQREVEDLGEIDARALNSMEVGEGVNVRVGRYGPYLEKADGSRASVPNGVAPDELTAEMIAEIFAQNADDGRELGVDPATGHMIVAKNGRYGPYVTEILPEEPEEAAPAEGEKKPAKGRKKAKPKPRTASIFKTMDLSTVTLEQALQLMSLPRVVGKDPADGEEITAQNGRFGPYLKKGSDSRSLENEEQLLTITLDEALAIYAQPKTRGRRAAVPPLREFGEDPVSGKPVKIKDGRFGPYITDGVTNITVPKSETVEGITEERAFELLAEKRAKGPAKKRTTRKTTTKKTTAKKSTAKKTATKKTATKKAE